MNNIRKVIDNNYFMLKYIFKFTPGLILYMTVVKILDSIGTVVCNVFTVTFVVDAYEKDQKVSYIVVCLLLFAMFYFVRLYINEYYNNIYFPKKKILLANGMQKELYTKAVNMDLARYDDSEFYNDFIWAMSQSEEKALNVLDTLGENIRSITSITILITFIFYLDSWGIVFALLSCILNFLLAFLINHISYKKDLESRLWQRKRDYTNRVFYQGEYAKEVRMSSIQNKLIKDFSAANNKLIKVIEHYGRKLFVFDWISFIFSRDVVLNGLYMVLILYRALVLKTLSYGEVVGLLNASKSFQGNLNRFAASIPVFSKYSLYIEKMRVFLNYKNTVSDTNQAKINIDKIGNRDIELKNVDFAYDNSSDMILKNINMLIKPGEKVAIVGYNGAGKSTLIKLLLRLYAPVNGKITYGKNDISRYALKEYRNQFKVLFQDFRIFAASIAENVLLDIYDKKYDKDIYKAVRLSMFEDKLRSFDDGIFAEMTREFSKKGINLSGGESQKLALARVFINEHAIIVLDEPSSALDPVSEFELNRTILNASSEKTVIFVSHRLSTTTIADKIYMLENGRIIEEGSHNKLMNLNGKYAQMFNMQAEKYLESKQQGEVE